jgi:hypothetical protein
MDMLVICRCIPHVGTDMGRPIYMYAVLYIHWAYICRYIPLSERIYMYTYIFRCRECDSFFFLVVVLFLVPVFLGCDESSASYACLNKGIDRYLFHGGTFG